MFWSKHSSLGHPSLSCSYNQSSSESQGSWGLLSSPYCNICPHLPLKVERLNGVFKCTDWNCTGLGSIWILESQCLNVIRWENLTKWHLRSNAARPVRLVSCKRSALSVKAVPLRNYMNSKQTLFLFVYSSCICNLILSVIQMKMSSVSFIRQHDLVTYFIWSTFLMIQ